MTSDKELAGYFREAQDWDADRVAQSRRSARTAWAVAGAGWVCTGMAITALILLIPLKRVEPFLIRVNETNGVVDTVPTYTSRAELPEINTRAFLRHYILVCERFSFYTAESDYDECSAFHTPQRNQEWAAQWERSNPASPLNVFKDGTTVRVQVSSVTFFKRRSGITDLAQVRYVKAQRAGGTGQEVRTYWNATIQYARAEPSKDKEQAQWNPLGFKVINFQTEPELAEPATSVSIATPNPASTPRGAE